MSLDRDELARLLSAGRWWDAADMIARLRPATVAPVADAAPRPEWVRITGRNGCGGAITVGKVYRVMSWDSQGSPVVANDEGYDWYLCGDGAPRGDTNTGLPTWEPCAAPAPSAAPDPRRTVGAVVKGPSSDVEFIVVDFMTVRRVERDATGISAPPLECDTFVRWATREECERHGIPYVERGAAPSPVKWSLYGGTIAVDLHHDGSVSRWLDSIGCERSVGTVFGSPATAPDHPTAASFAARRGQGAAGDQRVAAGLDAPASPAPAVDREGLARALRVAYQNATLGGSMGPWEESSESARKGYLAEADAAIAFLKANGGVA